MHDKPWYQDELEQAVAVYKAVFGPDWEKFFLATYRLNVEAK